MKVQASYTVEATFVVTITIYIIIYIFYAGMYVHDTLVLESVGNEVLAEKIEEDSEDTYWNADIKKEIEKSLFIMRVSSLNIEAKMASYGLEINANYYVLGKLRKYDCRIERERVNPTHYKWDYDILEGE